MSLFPDILGTIATFFQLGIGGAGLRSSAGTVEARTPDNSALAPIAGSSLTLSTTLSVGTTSTFTGAATFSSTLSSAGSIIGSNAISFEARGASGSNAAVRFSETAGLPRWGLGKGAIAESGSNAGSDFFLNAYTDAGTYLSTPIAITRSTGTIATPGMILNAIGALQTTGVGSGSVSGNARGTGAVDLQTSRTAATQVASGATSFVAGTGNIASGASAVAIGGGCVASGNNSVAMGNGCQATASNTAAFGSANQATSIYAFAAGVNSIASASGAFAFGNGSQAAQSFSTVFGTGGKSKRYGEFVLDSFGTPNAAGDSQASDLVAWVTTTNATPTVLNRTNCIYTLDNDSTLYFEVRVVARRTDVDNESAAFKLEGCIDRNTNAASTALVGTVTKTVIARDSAAWDVAIDADTTNGALRITVTGEAAKSIRWTAHTKLVEIVG